MEHPSGGWGAALSLDLLFHFCHFSELISLDLKKIVTNEFCINQRTNKDLGRSRLAGVPTQPECPRIPSYHLNWTLCEWEGGEGSVGGERTLENVGEVPGPMFQATLGGRSWQLAEYIGGLGKRGRAGNADAARLTVFAR